MKRLLLIGSILPLAMHAQETYELTNRGRTVTMTLEDKNPGHLSQWYAGVDLYAQFGSLSVGPGINAGYRVNDRFRVDANLSLPFDLLKSGKDVSKNSFTKYKPFTQYGLAGTWDFSSREKPKMKSLVFGSKRDTTFLTRIEIPKRKSYGLHFGYVHTVLPLGTIGQRDYENEFFPRINQSHALAIGLASSGSFQYQSSTRNYGKRGGQRFSQMYLDALIVASGTTYWAPEMGTASDYETAKTKAGSIGWRFGLTTMINKSPKGGAGVHYGLELGNLPVSVGKNGGTYLVVKIGVSIASALRSE